QGTCRLAGAATDLQDPRARAKTGDVDKIVEHFRRVARPGAVVQLGDAFERCAQTVSVGGGHAPIMPELVPLVAVAVAARRRAGVGAVVVAAAGRATHAGDVPGELLAREAVGDAVARHGAGLRVLGEAVERAAVERDLLTAAGARDHAEGRRQGRARSR